MVTYKTLKLVERDFWFPGWTYNATPGSRAAITGTVLAGSVFCLDPEAFDDRATLPAGMNLFPDKTGTNQIARVLNVTRPATGILGMIAGVSTTPFTVSSAGQWVTLITAAEACNVLCLGNFSAYATGWGAADGVWTAAPLAVGTNGANIPLFGGKSLFTENVASAALRFCTVGGLGSLPQLN